MSTQENGSRRAARRGSWGVWVVLGGAGLLVGGVILLVSSFAFGQISGEEFSPNTFDRRVFYYCEIPILHIQVTPIRRVATTKALESHLTSTKLVPVSAAKPRWDLVWMTNVKQQSEKCDARILIKYFDSTNESGNPHWLDWSQRKPELAKVLWPAVSNVAQQQLYIFVPELIECARLAEDPTKFQADLESLLSRKYGEFAQLQQQLGRHEDAVTLFTQALAHDARNAEALVGRSKSLEALGESEKAAADLVAAGKVGGRS